ncbi:MAG: hypothetical protein ABI992_00685 [Chthoniobacterales bacterium]
MRKTERRFYFALPRLLARAGGGNDSAAETNWLEANVAGGLIHGIAYLFAAWLFLGGLRFWQQILLALPLAIFVWLAWLVILCLNAFLIRLLRACGLFRRIADDRAQSILINLMITAFAIQLLREGWWFGLAGTIWIVVLTLNLLAAIILAFLHRHETAAT